ncbi:hypothetical protein [Pseudomonas protegens]|uniref:hypothetical protein n=1 Tax=Pseudomonas protegens TaxID=380021 RepID=UPI003819B45C
MVEHQVDIHLKNTGREIEHDRWEEVDAKDVLLWEFVNESLEAGTYSHNEIVVTVECDFSAMLERYEWHKEINYAYRHSDEVKTRALWGDGSSTYGIDFTATVVLVGDEALSEHSWYPVFFVEKYLYDIFFIMNMSLPGSCNFYGLRCGESKLRGESSSTHLTGLHFEQGHYDRLDGSKLAPMELPIGTVSSWYRRLGLGVKQKSETGVEKAIFSLLHLCRKDVDVSSVVWIFHALEAIYGTKVGEGFTNIVDRVAMLLELDLKEKKRLKKILRELYDFRSSFVHGGYKVHHPMSMEVFDARLNDDYSKMLGIVQSGFNIVVLSLQVLINNDWVGIKVDESLSGLQATN